MNIGKSNTYFFCDNTVVLDQVISCREKGTNGLTRGVGNLIAKIAHEIPDGQLLFLPSEYNSADNLTRPKATDELFANESN